MQKAPSDFPYDNPLTCYLFIADTGDVEQIGTDVTPQDAFNKAIEHYGKIIAVYPSDGQSSNAFFIDHHDYGIHFNCRPKNMPFTIIGYTHVSNENDSEQGKYVTFFIDSENPHIFDFPNFIDFFNKELENRFGWNICQKGGYNSSPKYHNPDTDQDEGFMTISLLVEPSRNCWNVQEVRTFWSLNSQDIWDKPSKNTSNETFPIQSFLTKHDT